MSMLENLDFIRENGIEAFLEKEEKKWKCPKCDVIVTCHGGTCMSCGFEKFKN
jgi:transposase